MRFVASIVVAVVLLAPAAAGAQTAWDTPSSRGFDLVPRTGANIEAATWTLDNEGRTLFAFSGLLRAGLVLDRVYELSLDAGFVYGILNDVQVGDFLNDATGDHGAAANPRFSLRGVIGERQWRLRFGGGATIPAIPQSEGSRQVALIGALMRGYQELWLWSANRASVIVDGELTLMPVDSLYLELRAAVGALLSVSANAFAPGQAPDYFDLSIDLSAAIGYRHDNVLVGTRLRQTFLPTFEGDQAQTSAELFIRPTGRIDNSSIELFGELRAMTNLDDPFGVTSAVPMWSVQLAFGIATTPIEIPDGRYGIRSVDFRGVERMDDQAIAACIGTHRRARFGIDIGIRGTPECGEPPFDGDHLLIDLFSYPWSPWPLFDENVFERDIERIERWYRARGFYEARVTATEVQPDSAREVDQSVEECGDGEGNCQAHVTFTVDEGEPVRVSRISIRFVSENGQQQEEEDLDLPEDIRQQLRDELQFHRDDPFDEAIFELVKQRMQRVLADESYGQARVRGEVKVNSGRHEAFVVFVIDAGLPNVINRICVTGHGELPPDLMLGVTYLDAGDRFRLELLEEAQRALYSLGAFSAVEVAPLTRAEEEAEDALPDDAFCTEPLAQVPDRTHPVDILIRVSTGRRYRIGVGGGFQAGQAVTVGNTGITNGQVNAAQWDLHLSFFAEDRNLFDRLVRARFEVRPRAIFDMPFLSFVPADPIPFGIQVNGSIRAPGVFEPRTNLVIDTRLDLGPMPYTNFFRFEPDAVIGLDHTWMDGRIYAGLFLHGNAFLPTDRQPPDPNDALPFTYAVYLEADGRVDLRDDPRNPHAGIYLGADVESSVQPLSSWSFLRWTADARGYVPLGDFFTVAARFQIGAMHVFGYEDSLDPDNRYRLHQLGPPALQLRGGGASGNRGYLPGLLGDAQDVYVTEPQSDEEIRRGAPVEQRSVRISGGNAMWQASLELRVRLTVDLGVVGFVDAGDVLRPEDPSDLSVGFRFDRPQLSFGLGLRYRTIIGPLRVDFALRPDELQDLGSERSLPPDCRPDRAQGCRPRNTLF
ncbi:MAG: BamA/TamA family outer membrane protein, partial [Myxococcales bacterium]|nr:BamA/TamA family outer membrane protein [Myxococcales bacterium]